MEPKRTSYRYALPLVILLIGCAVSGGLFLALKATADEQLSFKFQNDTDRIVSLLDDRMDRYTNVLYGARGLFAASQSVEAEEWKAYVSGLSVPEHYRGISGMSYIARIQKEDVENLPFTLYPESDKEEYFPITFSESFLNSTTSSIGFDVSSEARRNATLQLARSTDTPRATPVVAAVNTGVAVFSFYIPIYGPSEEGESPFIGYVSAGFRVKELFEGFSADPAFDKGLDAAIYDGAVSEGNPDGTLLYDSAAHRSAGAASSGLTRSVSLDISGQIWEIHFTARPGYGLGFFASLLPWMVLLGGIVLSALLAGIVGTLSGSRERALALAKKMTAGLEEEKAKAEATLGSLSEGVAVADLTGKLIYWNPAAEAIIGMKLDGSAPTDWQADYGIFYEDEKTPMPVEKQALGLALKGEDIRNMGEFVRNPGVPEGRHIAVSAKPVKLADGRLAGAVCIFRDSTKEFEVDRAKSEFVSLASHQLRTPLTSIKWYSELLEEDETLSKDQKEYAKEIAEAALRMNTLVAALLDVSRLDLGTFIIEPKQENLLKVMESAAKEQEPTFKKKKQTFTFEHPTAVPDMPLDGKLLFIIVQNLLSNAHKYSPEGASVTMRLIEKGDAGYEIQVQDTGYGIPKAQQNSVFGKLFRADNIRTLDVEGTGLGLYIIKTIVDAAGCSISFTSEEGKGTTFTVAIPKAGMKEKKGTKALSGAEPG